MKVTVNYHYSAGPYQGRRTEIHRMPGRWERPLDAVVDEILIEDVDEFPRPQKRQEPLTASGFMRLPLAQRVLAVQQRNTGRNQ